MCYVVLGSLVYLSFCGIFLSVSYCLVHGIVSLSTHLILLPMLFLMKILVFLDVSMTESLAI